MRKFTAIIHAAAIILSVVSSQAAFSDDTQSQTDFKVGTKPADTGTGFSTYSTFQSGGMQSYRVACNCSDLSLDTKVCPNATYLCYCSPSASLTCE